jgi:hypothetical protein
MWKKVLTVLLVGALIAPLVYRNAGLLQVSISWPGTTQQWQTILDLLQSAFTILAIVGAGIWTYFNYFKGRTYKKRLQPNASAEVLAIDHVPHLIATVRVENVGLREVKIQRGVLEVAAYTAPVTRSNALSLSSVRWNELAPFTVFASGTQLEPGETIEEQCLIVIHRNNHLAFRVSLEIYSQNWIPGFSVRKPWIARTSTKWPAPQTVILNKENGGEGDEQNS